MPDNDGMLGDMEFEDRLNDLGENQPKLLNFIARQQFSTSKMLIDHSKRIKSLEKTDKKRLGFVGAGGAILATAVTATIDYFLRRG